MEAADGRQVARVQRVAFTALVLALGLPASVAVDTDMMPRLATHSRPAELQDGDLVFRRGRDAIGRIVLSHGDQPRYSHVGMVVLNEGRTLVAHALPDTPSQPGGVRLEPVEAFVSPMRASDVGYYRPQPLSPVQREAIRHYLTDAVGLPFDLRFEYSSDDAVYCTELVLKALSVVGLDLTPTLATVRVVMLDEPAFAPDALWRSERVVELLDSRQWDSAPALESAE